MKNVKYSMLTTITAAAALCLCLYILAGEPSGEGFSVLLRRPLFRNPLSRSPEKEGDDDLRRVLTAVDGDRTVIITAVNDAWARPGSVLDLFVESFLSGDGTAELLRRLIVVALDPTAMARCTAAAMGGERWRCFYLETPGVDFSSEKRFMTEDYLKMMWRRIEFLRRVLELGYSFVFTDADVMWFRNPFPYFPSTAESDIAIACDYFNGSPSDLSNRANGGFLHVRSTPSTIEFYKHWRAAGDLRRGQHDQSVFDEIKGGEETRRTGVRIVFLDTGRFGGFCQPSRDLDKVVTMHANCCVGIDAKIHDLGILIEDWKNYTASRTAGGGCGGGIKWRAPVQCRV